MKIAALILGIMGGLIVSFVMFLGAAISSGADSYLAYAVPVLAFLGAGMAMRFALPAGVMLVASGGITLHLIGMNFFGFFQAGLLFIAGALALLSLTDKKPETIKIEGGA